MSKDSWPAWYFGPDGARDIFEREEDVPKGWQNHPSKVKQKADPFDHDGDGKPGGSKPKVRKPRKPRAAKKPPTAKAAAPDAPADADVAGKAPDGGDGS